MPVVVGLLDRESGEGGPPTTLLELSEAQQ
eukprot:COSAG01_NODE_61549_length_289_cov_0.536842_1_plen_29_part_01